MQTSAAKCHKSFAVCEAILAMEALILALMAATRLKYTQVSRLFRCPMLDKTKFFETPRHHWPTHKKSNLHDKTHSLTGFHVEKMGASKVPLCWVHRMPGVKTVETAPAAPVTWLRRKFRSLTSDNMDSWKADQRSQVRRRSTRE